MKDPKYVALDTETTGLDHRDHAIIELAAIALDANLKPIDENDCYQTLVQPFEGAGITPRALEINGHHWCTDPESAPYKRARPYEKAWDGFIEYLERHFPEPSWLIMIGWNPSFDEAFLRKMHARTLGLDEEEINELPRSNAAYTRASWPFHYHKLDYLSICRYLDIRAGRTRRTYKLERIAGHYFGSAMVKTAEHTALGDTFLAIKTLEAVENDKSRNKRL